MVVADKALQPRHCEGTIPLFQGLFRGRDGFHARRDDEGRYAPVEGEPDMQSHLQGEQASGFYLMRTDNTVLCSCADIDNHENSNARWVHQTDSVCESLRTLGMPYTREISQSGSGSHIWMFYDEPVPAYLTRAFWKVVGKQSRVQLPEVYPRQDRLTGRGMGNLVLYPLWNKSRFVDDRFEEILPAEALKGKAVKNPIGSLKEVIHSLTGDVPSEPKVRTSPDELPERVEKLMLPGSLLESRWSGDMTGMPDRSRSALCFAIAQILVQARIPTPEIEQTITAWCLLHDYTARGTPEWVERTVARSYDGVIQKEELKSDTVETLLTSARGALRDRVSGHRTIYPTGIESLDASIEGTRPGELMVVAARPSIGKTAFGIQMADHVAKQVPVLLISEEMSRREIGNRAVLTIVGGEDETVDAEKADKLLAEHYGNRHSIYTVENCTTIERCEEVIERYVTCHGVKFIALDYLQLLRRRKTTSRYEDVSDISRRLKQAAGRFDVSILALCQFNRAAVERESGVPQMSNIRDSGQIEQDADLVLSLQWPDRNKSDYRIWCHKRRNGPIKSQMVKTNFNPGRQLFHG